MKLKKHRILLSVLSLILIIGITFSVNAIVGAKKPSVTAGEFLNRIADRVEITLENTVFTLKKSTTGAEKFTLTMYLCAKKTQGDFYGIINSFELSGIAYDSIVFTALNENTTDKTLDSLVLTSTNGQPDTFKWQIDVTMSVSGKGVYTPSVKLDIVSGMTKTTAQNKLIEIPLSITVK